MTILLAFQRFAIAASLMFFLLTPLGVVAQYAGAQASDAPEASSGMPPDEARLLADLLKDDAKRAALIDQLERAGGVGEAPAPAEKTSLGRRIAETSQAAVSGAASSFLSLAEQISRAPAAFNTLSLEQIDLLLDALRDLGLVIAVTTAVYLGLRVALKPIFRRAGARAVGGMVRTVITLIWTVALDVGAVLAAWGAGYLVALFFTGQTGSVGVRQALYLNAFLLAGLARVLIRAILAPSAPELRFVSASDRGARIMARWFGVIVSILAYGQLLIAPIATRQISPEAGAGLSTLLALIAILIAAGLTLYGRRPVAGWMLGADTGRERSGGARFLAASWHLPVLIYLFGLFVVVATRPDGVIWPILIRSAQVLAAIIAGVVVSGFITRSIARGFNLPERISRPLPTLERRLNTFIPRVLGLVRAAIVIAVAAYAISVIGIFDVGAWLSGERGGRVSSALISATLILALAFAAWISLASWVDYRLNPDFGSRPTAREQTLLSLLKNALTILLLVFAFMFILSEFGVNIAPLIASAGVFGLAIGFGAQKMVQDIITGIFIQFENAMNVGDVVSLNGTTGVVEKLTIRSVSLRDVEGVFHIIPFSSVDMVSNYMREYGNFVCDMGIAYREDITEAKQAMHDAFDELRANPDWTPLILADLQWFGLQALADSAVVLRARIKCAPGQQWGVGRAYNEICKRVFDERDIEIPFPHQTIYFGVDKSGNAPPMHILSEKDGAPASEVAESGAAPQDAPKPIRGDMPMEKD